MRVVDGLVILESPDDLLLYATMQAGIERRAREAKTETDKLIAELRESLRAKFEFLNRSVAQSRRQRRVRQFQRKGDEK